MENLEHTPMSDKERQSILVKTSFKNVSGNWQFKGDMTPERFLRIIEGVHSTRINQQQKSLWDEVAYIFNDSTNSESAIRRCSKLFTIDRREIDKSLKP